jgi:prepilin-type N-terminal cleavage/methylation domain-containing protein
MADLMKKAFTLIELLVVIAIIAILAAILFPVFAKAKEAAKKTGEMTHMKQLGTSVQIYLADYDDTFMSAYYYKNDTDSSGGYVHWSGVLQPYVKNIQMFVGTNDPSKGFAPTNYSTATNNRGYGAAPGQTPQTNADIDDQAPRISFTANSMVMPRKRRTIDPMNVISGTALDDVSNTIMLAPQTHYATCLNDTSSASGVAFKSHRPANGILLPSGLKFQGEAPAEVGLSSYLAVDITRAKSDLAACKLAAATTYSHIVYSQPDRWGTGAIYVFTDTHAKYSDLAATLNPNNFQWGKRAYTAGGGVVTRADGVTPVN